MIRGGATCYLCCGAMPGLGCNCMLSQRLISSEMWIEPAGLKVCRSGEEIILILPRGDYSFKNSGGALICMRSCS